MKRTISAILLCLSTSILVAQAKPSPRLICHVDSAPLSDADIAMTKDDYSRAHRLYAKQAEQEPENLALQADDVSALLRWKHIDEAVGLAGRMVQSHPDNSLALTAMAEAQWERGDSGAALTAVSKAIALDACNYRALSHAAEMEFASGQRMSAAQHAQLAHQLSPLRVTEIWAETRPIADRAQAFEAVAAATPDEAEEQKAHYKANADLVRQVLSSPCTVTAAHPRIHITLYRLNPNHEIFDQPVGFDLKINGHPRTLALSSGDFIALSAETAKGLDLNDRVPLYTRVANSDRSSKTTFARIANLKIGDLEYHNCPAVIYEENFYRSGIIPVSFFSDFITTIDFARLEMRFDELPRAVEGTESHWSHVVMDGKEYRSINGGDWPSQIADRPPEVADWTAIYRHHSDIFVPTKIDPVHTRLFVVDMNLPHQMVSSQTAKDALLVSQYPNTDKQFQKMLGGSRYALQFGGVIQAIDTWNVSSDLAMGGILGVECMGRVRVSFDFRDNLALFQHSEKH